MLTRELAKCQEQAVTKIVGEDPFVFSPQLIKELHLFSLAGRIMQLADWLRPALPAGAGGRPVQYRDESILVALLVMSLWQLLPETMVRRLKRWPELATACGVEPGAVITFIVEVLNATPRSLTIAATRANVVTSNAFSLS